MKDKDAKDREFFMEKVHAEEQQRIRQEQDRNRLQQEQKPIEVNRQLINEHGLKTEEKITIKGHTRDLRNNLRIIDNSRTKEQTKERTQSPNNSHSNELTNRIRTNPHLQTQIQADSNSQPEPKIELDPYFQHYSKVENLEDKGLLEQSAKVALDGTTHQINRVIQKMQIKAQEKAQQQEKNRAQVQRSSRRR